MSTGRIEAFSDGVIAVIITIMVLDLKVPHDARWSTLLQSGSGLAIYLLSFVVVGIFWMNHHHALHAARVPNPPLMWSNLAVLFVLSLIPFATAYVSDLHGSALPVACYALVLAFASLSFTVLNGVIAAQQPAGDIVRLRFRRFIWKGATVFASYLIAIPLAYVNTAIAYAIFVLIPILYVVPDGAIPATAE